MVELAVPPEASTALVGLREAVRLEEDGVAPRLTVPAKPFMLDIVIDAVFGDPVITVTVEGAEIVKSVTVTVILEE
jgi:hypothetical protein